VSRRIVKYGLDWLDTGKYLRYALEEITSEDRENLFLRALESFGSRKGLLERWHQIDQKSTDTITLENKSDGIFLKNGTVRTNIAFRGKWFLKHRHNGDAFRMVHEYVNRFSKLTRIMESEKTAQRYRRKRREICPATITRADAVIDIVTTKTVTEIAPDLEQDFLYVPFPYTIKKHTVKNKATGGKSVVTGLTYMFGDSYTLVIYDKGLQKNKSKDPETRELTGEYIESLNLNDNERLMRIELRLHKSRTNAFIMAEILKKPPNEVELVKKIYQKFYKSHRVRVNDGSRSDKSKLPEYKPWKDMFSLFASATFEQLDESKPERTKEEVYSDVRARLGSLAKRCFIGEGIDKRTFLEAAEDAYKSASGIQDFWDATSGGLKKSLLQKKPDGKVDRQESTEPEG
jgi:hypothetical protein